MEYLGVRIGVVGGRVGVRMAVSIAHQCIEDVRHSSLHKRASSDCDLGQANQSIQDAGGVENVVPEGGKRKKNGIESSRA